MDTFCRKILEPIPHRCQETSVLMRLKEKYYTYTYTHTHNLKVKATSYTS